MSELVPKPVSTHVKCSVCDLPWDDHVRMADREEPLEECIRLLKAAMHGAPHPREWKPIPPRMPGWQQRGGREPSNASNPLPRDQFASMARGTATVGGVPMSDGKPSNWVDVDDYETNRKMQREGE